MATETRCTGKDIGGLRSSRLSGPAFTTNHHMWWHFGPGRLAGGLELALLFLAKAFVPDYARLEKQVQNDHIRTIRIDASWRGVVVAPEAGDVYCLLTVLPHDKAIDYAASRRAADCPFSGYCGRSARLAMLPGRMQRSA